MFPHTTTPREIVFWTGFLCWIIKNFKEIGKFIILCPVTTSLSLFMFITFFTSIIGIEPIENLGRFKNELLPVFVLFLIVKTEYKTIQEAKRLFIVPAVAFAIYTLIVITESFSFGIEYFWSRSIRENQWIDGYGHIGITLLPITLGMCLLIKNKRFKYPLMFLGVIEFFIIAMYSFTSLISSMLVLLLWIFFARPRGYRLWMTAFLLLISLLSVMVFNIYRDTTVIKSYKTRLQGLINPIEEIKDMYGFSNRVILWKAAFDIIKDRPVYGYGWGIRSFQKLATDERYLKKWQTKRPVVYEFFNTHRKTFFPPHNLLIEIAIQSGLLGVISFIIFNSVFIFYLIKTAIYYKTSDDDRNFSFILVGGTFLSFMIMNLMNNELGNISGKILFVVLGAATSWITNREV